MQEIYINLDDSGKLTRNETISVYGGIVFLSKKEKDLFITQYKKIVHEIKCSYCKNMQNCNFSCPEIKNTNIKPSHKRWLMNYIKKYFIVGLVIENDLVYPPIIKSKAARGRFTDYAIRRIIKQIIKNLIETKKINPLQPIRLYINIDEQTTKNNGYYKLFDGIVEELKYGISNFNYESYFSPIIKGKLELFLSYRNSKYNYAVQAADLIAGTIRRTSLNSYQNKQDIKNSLNNFTDLVIILP